MVYRDEYDLTIGSVGAQGPKGDLGPQGPQSEPGVTDVYTRAEVHAFIVNLQAQIDFIPMFWSQISAGGDHTCGLKSDGTLACWCDGREGQSNPLPL